MSPFAALPPIVGTPFSPTGRLAQPFRPEVQRFKSLVPSLHQLPKNSPLTKSLLQRDFSELEKRVLAQMPS